MAKRIIRATGIRRDRLSEWIPGETKTAKDGTRFQKHDCALSGWQVVEGSGIYERLYRRYKRRSHPSRAVVWEGTKINFILVIVNIALLIIILKLFS